MKNWLFVTLVVLLLASLVLLVYAPLMFSPAPPSSLTDHPADTVRLGIEGTLTFCSDICPPYVTPPDGPPRGYAVDLLQAIYEPAGYTVKLVVTPWSRCLQEVQQGHISGVIGTDPDEAPELTFPSEDVGIYRPRFITLRDSQWTYRGLSSLREVRLGVIQGYSYAPDLDHYIQQQAQSERILFSKGESPHEHLFDALNKGKIDVFIENLQTHEAFVRLRSSGNDLLRIAGALPFAHSLFVAFNPQAAVRNDLTMRYDRRITKLRRDGALDNLLARYKLRDWQADTTQTSPTSLTEEHR